MNAPVLDGGPAEGVEAPGIGNAAEPLGPPPDRGGALSAGAPVSVTLAASVAAHAALAVLAGLWLAPAGMEADPGAIEVAIVVEAAPEPVEAAPVPPGDAALTVDAEPTEAVAAEKADEVDGPEPVAPDEVAVETAGEVVTERTAEADVFEAAGEVEREVAEAVDPVPAEAPVDPETAVVAEETPLPPDPLRPELSAPPRIELAEPEPPEPDRETLALLAVPPRIEPIAEAADPFAESEVPAPEPRPVREPRAAPEAEEKTPARRETAPRKAAPDRPARAAEAKPPARKSEARAAAPGVAGARAAVSPRAGQENYGRRVAGHVDRFKRYPAQAERAGIKGVVRVSIAIDAGGRLASARVAGSSGHQVLDAEALATLRRAAPYPRPPEGTAPVRFTFTLRFGR